MIESLCTCGQPFTAHESAAGSSRTCSACQSSLQLVCAETLPEGAGVGDFDARLVVERGPEEGSAGRALFLGGVAPIQVGKLPSSPLLLPGSNVSRHHATLSRLDFGPSRWEIEDHHSTNGLWINGERVTGKHELRDGDRVVIGEYELRYEHAPDPEPVVATAAVAGAGAGVARSSAPRPVCPSCGLKLAPNAKICIDCGIYIDTGRPLLTAKGFDENDLYIKAENAIRIISWISPTGLYPVASEGFGTFKPFALWGLVILTVLTSLIGFLANAGGDRSEELEATASYELWAGDANVKPELPNISAVKRLTPAKRARILQMITDRPHGEYRAPQLLTHAFLHAGFFHLAGNMLFMIVLGVSVNSLIGNVRLLIIYPLLAIAGGAGHLLASRHVPIHPMVGASGAIMGLAGMYLVLFPIHKMYMAAWWRWGLFRGFHLSWKLWPMRGFWVVLFYISFDVIFTALGIHDQTAHWAHLGGFMAGVATGLLLLLTRQVNARGGDLLSVTLGRHAWALLGKPATRADSTPVPAAPSVAIPSTPLNFPE